MTPAKDERTFQVMWRGALMGVAVGLWQLGGWPMVGLLISAAVVFALLAGLDEDLSS